MRGQEANSCPESCLNLCLLAELLPLRSCLPPPKNLLRATPSSTLRDTSSQKVPRTLSTRLQDACQRHVQSNQNLTLFWLAWDQEDCFRAWDFQRFRQSALIRLFRPRQPESDANVRQLGSNLGAMMPSKPPTWSRFGVQDAPTTSSCRKLGKSWL